MFIKREKAKGKNTIGTALIMEIKCKKKREDEGEGKKRKNVVSISHPVFISQSTLESLYFFPFMIKKNEVSIVKSEWN